MVDRLVVIGREQCIWCDKLKDLFKEHNVPFKYILADDSTKQFLVDCGFTTVPQVFLNGTAIGGYEEMKLMLERKNEPSD